MGKSMSSTAARMAVASVAFLAWSTADAQAFNAKPGAWEMTVTPSGNMIPPEVLAKMPPERRAMVEKQMAAGGAGNVQTRKSCVKKEDLDQDSFMKSNDPNCAVKTVSRSQNKLVLAMTCTGERAATGTMSFEAKTPEAVVGAIDMDRGNGSKFHIGMAGKWIGNSCEGIEPPPAKQ